MAIPNRERWFCWREFTVVEGEKMPRLLIPWADPEVYEHPADCIFDTEEEAEKWKAENAPFEEWILCRMDIRPLSAWRQCPDCNEVKKYDADLWRNYSNKPGSGVRYVCGDCAPKEGDDDGDREEPGLTTAEAREV